MFAFRLNEPVLRLKFLNPDCQKTQKGNNLHQESGEVHFCLKPSYSGSGKTCHVSWSLQVKYPVDSSTDLHPDVYGEKGWTFLKLSKSFYPRAIECFRKALELQPDNWEWNNGYAITLYRTELVLHETDLLNQYVSCSFLPHWTYPVNEMMGDITN